MTCLEILKEMNPLFDKGTTEDVVRGYCPFEWGINYPPEQKCCHGSCKECWDHIVIVED